MTHRTKYFYYANGRRVTDGPFRRLCRQTYMCPGGGRLINFGVLTLWLSDELILDWARKDLTDREIAARFVAMVRA